MGHSPGNPDGARDARIFRRGEQGLSAGAGSDGLSPRVPDSSPALISTKSWYCPTGMVMTGAAIGHIPNDKDKWTRPVDILAECRRLIKK